MKEFTINQVYELRTASGITQETLAEAIGVTRQTVIAIEKGNYTPSVMLALNIARFFKKSLEEVFQIKYGPSIKTRVVRNPEKFTGRSDPMSSKRS